MGMLQDTLGGGQPQNQEGQPQQQGGGSQDLIKQATKLLYSDNFESMVKMFQQHGKEGFPQAMAMAINGVLDRLEKDQGQPLDAQTASGVGIAIFEILLQDLAEGGVLPNIDKQDVLKSVEAVLTMWAKGHPDQANPEEMKGVIEQMARQMSQGGKLEGGAVVPPSQGGGAPQQPPPGQPPQGV